MRQASACLAGQASGPTPGLSASVSGAFVDSTTNPLVVKVVAGEEHAAPKGYVYEKGCDIGERMRYGSYRQ